MTVSLYDIWNVGMPKGRGRGKLGFNPTQLGIVDEEYGAKGIDVGDGFSFLHGRYDPKRLIVYAANQYLPGEFTIDQTDYEEYMFAMFDWDEDDNTWYLRLFWFNVDNVPLGLQGLVELSEGDTVTSVIVPCVWITNRSQSNQNTLEGVF